MVRILNEDRCPAFILQGVRHLGSTRVSEFNELRSLARRDLSRRSVHILIHVGLKPNDRHIRVLQDKRAHAITIIIKHHGSGTDGLGDEYKILPLGRSRRRREGGHVIATGLKQGDRGPELIGAAELFGDEQDIRPFTRRCGIKPENDLARSPVREPALKLITGGSKKSSPSSEPYASP